MRMPRLRGRPAPGTIRPGGLRVRRRRPEALSHPRLDRRRAPSRRRTVRRGRRSPAPRGASRPGRTGRRAMRAGTRPARRCGRARPSSIRASPRHPTVRWPGRRRACRADRRAERTRGSRWIPPTPSRRCAPRVARARMPARAARRARSALPQAASARFTSRAAASSQAV